MVLLGLDTDPSGPSLDKELRGRVMALRSFDIDVRLSQRTHRKKVVFF